MSRRFMALSAVGLAVLLGVLYGPALLGPAVQTGFAWVDDDITFVENPHLQEAWDAAGLARLIRHPYFFDWTPVYWVLLWVQRGLFGNAAVAYRAVSLVVFGCALLVLLRLLAGWTGQRGASLAAVCLLAAHPLLVEPIVWPTSQKTVLSLLVALLALTAYDRMLHGRARFAAWGTAALLTVLAMGIKLRGLVLPFGLCAYDICYQWQRRGRVPSGRGVRVALLRAAPLVVLALAWAAVNQRLVFAGSVGVANFDRWLGGSRAASLASHAVIELRTLGHWLTPHRRYFLYPFRVYDAGAGLPWLCAAALGAMAVGLICAARPAQRPWAVFGLAWYALQRAITAGFFPYQWWVMADRYSFVAAPGLALAVLLPWLRLPAPRRRAAGAVVVGLVLLLGGFTWIHSTRMLTGYGAGRLAHPRNVRVRFRELMHASGEDLDRQWEALAQDRSAPLAVGRLELARAAAHWAQDRHGQDPRADATVRDYCAAVVTRPYADLVEADYDARTGRPGRAWERLREALAGMSPRFDRWRATVRHDLASGVARDWRHAYLVQGDAYLRFAELRAWERVLPWAFETAPDAESRRVIVALGRGIRPSHAVWRRRWVAARPAS